MAAASAATGLRSWLQTHSYGWLTPRRLRRLTIAAIAKKGKVVGTDLSEEMLLIAAANAAAKGLKNYSTKAANVCELPFDDDTFTGISCRMGFMFFP